MRKFLRNRKLLLAAAVGGLLLLFLALSISTNGKTEPELFEVKEADINQVLDASGSLEASTAVDLAFRKAGQVKGVLVDEGDRVKKGDLLAEIENSKEAALVKQYESVLHEEEANLQLKLAMASQQDIDIAKSEQSQALANQEKTEVDIQNARIDLENTKKIQAEDIATAELEVENAALNLEKITITTRTSGLGSDLGLENAKTSFYSAIGQLLIASKSGLQSIDKIVGIDSIDTIFKNKEYLLPEPQLTQIKDYYVAASLYYQDLKKNYETLSISSELSQLAATKPLALDLSETMNQLLLAASNMLDKVLLTESFDLDDVIALRAEISTDGTTFNTSLSTYNSARKALDEASSENATVTGTAGVDVRTAEILLEQKKQNLVKVTISGESLIAAKEAALKLAQAQLKVQQSLVERARAALQKLIIPPREVDIAPYRARVEKAAAQLLNAENDFSDTQLRAPFDGILTARNIEVGEQAAGSAASVPALAMIDDSSFHVDVNIPETQINRVDLESRVLLTFDALPDEQFEGKILTINAAADDTQSTVYYKVKVALQQNDARLRADMTADVRIETLVPRRALLIPEKALQVEGDQKKVLLVTDVKTKQAQAVVVETGVKDQYGMIEIISGLKASDFILIPNP